MARRSYELAPKYRLLRPLPNQVPSLSISLSSTALEPPELSLSIFSSDFNSARVFAEIMSSREAESVNDYEVVHRGDSKEKVGSSGLGSTEEATQTLLEMQREAVEWRDRKRRTTATRRTTEPSPKKQKKLAATKEVESIRLTANFGAYWEFMKRIAPKIRQWHRNAYRGSIFEHYISFGAPAPDRPTLELLLSYYDRANDTFSIPDSKTGALKSVKFDLQWVHNHTYFPIYGEVPIINRDSRNRIWVQYFANLFKTDEGKKLKKGTITHRKYLEGQLERLVESTEKKDIDDFALLQILYQCSMIWCPRSGEGIPRPILRYLDSIERVKGVAWAQLFYSEIIRGIGVALEGKKKPGVTYVPGCMTLLCVSSMVCSLWFIIFLISVMLVLVSSMLVLVASMLVLVASMLVLTHTMLVLDLTHVSSWLCGSC